MREVEEIGIGDDAVMRACRPVGRDEEIRYTAVCWGDEPNELPAHPVANDGRIAFLHRDAQVREGISCAAKMILKVAQGLANIRTGVNFRLRDWKVRQDRRPANLNHSRIRRVLRGGGIVRGSILRPSIGR